MKRRDFLMTISPVIFVPWHIKPVWKRVVGVRRKWIVNPEWLNAPYEETVMFFDAAGEAVQRLVPLRFKRGVNGEFLVVPREILVDV